MTKRQKIFSALGQFFKNVFTKNIPLKIIALVFALLLWGYVLSEVKPKYVKRMYDVEITLRNEDVLKQKGWVLVNSETFTTDVNIEAGIDKHSMLDTSNVKCYVDLEKIPISDQDPDRKTVILNVMTSLPEYGALKSISTEQIELTIERTWTGDALIATVRMENELPAIVKTGDTLPEYYECIPPKTVRIPPLTGLKSEIDQISRAEVTIDLASFENIDMSDIPGIYSLSVPVRFYNVDGELIDSPSTHDIKVTVDNIEIRRYKEVPIELNTEFDETIDKELYDCECTFANGEDRTTRIYGSSEELAKISLIQSEAIKPNQTEGEETLTVGLIIPSSVKTDKKQTVSVTVNISKRRSDNVSFEIPIEYIGPDDHLIVGEKPERLNVNVSGLVDAMQLFDPSWITATVDLRHYAEGNQTVPITVRFKGTVLHLQDYVVEEPEDGTEPLIRITFKSRNGMIYVIELPQNTVSVNLQAKEAESTEG